MWALESKLLDYIESEKEVLKAGYNQFLKETVQSQKESGSQSSTATTATDGTEGSKTRRRRTKQAASSLKQLQINTANFVELSFD